MQCTSVDVFGDSFFSLFSTSSDRSFVVHSSDYPPVHTSICSFVWPVGSWIQLYFFSVLLNFRCDAMLESFWKEEQQPDCYTAIESQPDRKRIVQSKEENMFLLVWPCAMRRAIRMPKSERARFALCTALHCFALLWSAQLKLNRTQAQPKLNATQ